MCHPHTIHDHILNLTKQDVHDVKWSLSHGVHDEPLLNTCDRLGILKVHLGP
jgi:hypothetical protein